MSCEQNVALIAHKHFFKWKGQEEKQDNKEFSRLLICGCTAFSKFEEQKDVTDYKFDD